MQTAVTGTKLCLIMKGGYTTTLTAMQRVAHAILSGRILLHLRQAANVRVISSRFDTADPSGAPSVSWAFRRRSQQTQEPRSFIETVRDEFRQDTETWFGTEATGSGGGVSTATGTSLSTDLELGVYDDGVMVHGEERHVVGADAIGDSGGGERRSRRGRKKDRMEHHVRVVSSPEGENVSHLEMDP